MFSYPALYDAASKLSSSSQKTYLRLIKAEYVLLIVASILSLNLYATSQYYALYAFVFILLLFTVVSRTWQKPEQDWYKGRALAESIKTSCWRYCMKADPFGVEDSEEVSKEEFRIHLRGILEANRHIGDKIPPDSAANNQITESMLATRMLSLESRVCFYRKHRILEQQTWYRDKAKTNRRLSKVWMIVAIAIYIAAIALILARISYPEIKIWPIEPLIVTASTIVGWTQIKKFNELASSYTLTAYEIGLTIGVSKKIENEEDFSKFVVEAEQAFSREHTQWVARQTFQ